MAMTLIEKVLADHAGRDQVRPGEIVWADIDLVLSHDLTMQGILQALKKLGDRPVFDKRKVAIVLEHVVPSASVSHANVCETIRQWCYAQDLEHFYDMGRHGIAHIFLPDLGLITPGDLVLGADSHTCTLGVVGAFACGVGSTDAAVAMTLGQTWLKVPPTYRIELVGEPAPWVTGKDIFLALLGRIGAEGALYTALEFTGPGLQHLNMDNRSTLCNMAIEAGAKTGMIAPDAVTADYVRSRPLVQAGKKTLRDLGRYHTDAGADLHGSLTIDLSAVELVVSRPPSPDNVVPVSSLGQVPINQVFIGTCTNGRLEDLRLAARVLKGRQVHKRVRMLIVPASQQVLLAATREGLVETFIEAGAMIGTPGCGPCTAIHMGPLAKGDRAVYTNNRNFLGRLGDSSSEVYLAGPAVAAASAVAGRIATPDQIGANQEVAD